MGWLGILVSLGSTCVGQIFFKIGAGKIGPCPGDLAGMARFFVAVLQQPYILGGLGLAFLQEKVSLAQWAGFGLIVVGVSLAAASGRATG